MVPAPVSLALIEGPMRLRRSGGDLVLEPVAPAARSRLDAQFASALSFLKHVPSGSEIAVEINEVEGRQVYSVHLRPREYGRAARYVDVPCGLPAPPGPRALEGAPSPSPDRDDRGISVFALFQAIFQAGVAYGATQSVQAGEAHAKLTADLIMGDIRIMMEQVKTDAQDAKTRDDDLPRNNVTPRDVMRVYGVSRKTAQKWLREVTGRAPGVTDHLRVSRDEFLAWKAEREMRPRSRRKSAT